MLSYRPFGRKLGPWHAVILLVLGMGVAGAGVDIDRMLLLASQRYGNSGAAAVVAWREMLTMGSAESETSKLKRVNAFFTQKIRFGDDIKIWGVADYWATPLEVLGRGEGDCEDFAIAKYVTLKLMGVENPTPSPRSRTTVPPLVTTRSVRPASLKSPAAAYLGRPSTCHSGHGNAYLPASG